MAERSDYSYYTNLWTKAILLEIVNRETKSLLRSFAFSLPPEGMSISIPQRENTTKTFGGVFIDDYGVDNGTISVRGSTGNTQLKKVYWNGGTREISGKNEAYLILEELLQYKIGLKDYDKYDIRLYDLSSYLFDDDAKDISSWVVRIKDGRIERSKDKPFFYSYNLEFFIVGALGRHSYNFSKAYAAKNPFEKIDALLNALKAGSDALKKALADYRDIIDKIRAFQDKLDEMRRAVRQYTNAVQGFIGTTIDGVNSVFGILSFPADLALDLVTAARDIRAGYEALITSFSDGITDIENKADRIQEIASEVFDLENNSCSVVESCKKMGNFADVQIVPPDFVGASTAVNADDPTETLDIGFILTYGYRETVATSETRLDTLAAEVYGSPDYADTIAAYNGIVGDSGIVPGMTIKLPYLTQSEAQFDNEVYSLDLDSLGSDIALSGDGDLVLAEFNDYAATSGAENVGQAVDLRLSEYDGARIRVDAYGIKLSRSGFDSMSTAVLVSSIRETLIQDPRIQAVYDFKFLSDGDAQWVSFTVDLRGGGRANLSFAL